MNRLWISLYLLVLLGCSSPEPTFTLKVIDGDTIVVADSSNQIKKVDLAFIDAPEREQPGGRDSKLALGKLLNSTNIKLHYLDNNHVEIFDNDQSVNLQMVRQGLAWALTDNKNAIRAVAFAEAQKMAQQELLGLWSLGHGLMVAPWQWRAQATEVSAGSMQFKRKIEQQQLARATQLEQQKRMAEQLKLVSLTNKVEKQ